MIYPPDFDIPARKREVAAVAARVIAYLAPRRRTVVQAGGCSGMWPVELAKYFDRVYTFEPEPTNFACLQQNVQGIANITAFPYALGDHSHTAGLTRPKPGAGLWRVSGPGDVQVVMLDAVLGDTPVDALVLDVEGSEVNAWRGAERIIAAHHPLLWFEHRDNKSAVEAWLAAHHYGPPVRSLYLDHYSVYQR